MTASYSLSIKPATLQLMPNTWLITGGCGFIGVNLIERILEENNSADIRIMDNLSRGTKDDLREVAPAFREISLKEIENSPFGIELVVADIRDFQACLRVCRGVELALHLAANTGVSPSVENPRLDMEVNVIGAFNMLEASRQNGVQKFIFASSGAPLGEVEPPIHEEKAPRPVSPYGASKLAGEGYCSAYYRTFGLKTAALRFGNVYGPRSKHKNSVVAKFFRQALRGQTLEIYGDGAQTRDFIYIDDLIQAIWLCARADTGGEVFQIATYRETTVNEIAKAIKKLIELETNKEVNIVHTSPRAGDVRRNYSDISKAKKILGYDPQVELADGLEKTWRWFEACSEKP